MVALEDDALLEQADALADFDVGETLTPSAASTYFDPVYQFGGGIAYGCFTGFVLDVIGTGAAATKYNALASLSNISILYMTKLDGWASTDHGTVSMLLVDASSEIVGICVFITILMIVRPGKEKLPEPEPAKPELPPAKVVR